MPSTPGSIRSSTTTPYDSVRQPIEGVLPVGDGVAVVAGAPQLLGDQLANAALVLDDKDATVNLGQLGGGHPKDWIL